ncbi:MAG: ATP-binding cassette domain-containing protein, partial [Flavobacteriales bacterium]
RLVMKLSFQNATVGYDPKTPLVTLPNLDLKAGGLHVLLGPNGSGKSTLIRSVVGVHSLLEGDVFVRTESRCWRPSDRGWWRDHVALVPSTPPSQVGLTVEEVLALSGDANLAARRHPRLQPWLPMRFSHLSDGQAQQVMVARAMLQSSHWVVLDEPTAFLDVEGQHHLWDMLTDHVASGGSAVMATHDLLGVTRWLAGANATLRESSSVHFLSNGRLESVELSATLEELEAKFAMQSKAR